jgi:drug/metabolite transporter (DMT)-like permease
MNSKNYFKTSGAGGEKGNLYNMTEHSKGLIAINIAAIIFGSAALYGKLNVSPFWIVSMRGLFASVTLLMIGAARKEIVNPKSNLKDLAITGVVLSLHWLTFFLSVQLSGVAIATLTFAAFPLFTLIIEALKHKRHLKVIEVAAAIVIILAVTLLVKFNNVSSGVFTGTAAGLASAVLFALFGIISKNLTARLPTLTVSFIQNLIVCIILMPFLLYAKPMPDESVEWIFLVLLGIVTTALMHQLYFYALKRLSASTCSGFVALEPVYAIVFAAIFFSEPLPARVAVGGVLILSASLLLFSRSFNYAIKK